AFSPDGRLFAAAGTGGAAHVWDLATGQIVRKLEGPPGQVAFLAFAPDGRTVATGGWAQTLQVWDLPTGKERARLAGHRRDITCLAFSPDGRRLVSGSGDTTALVWDVGAVPAAGGPAELTAAQEEGLWEDLAGDDARKAYEAVWGLAAAPGRALPLLKERL